MSIGSLSSIAGSVAGTSLAQTRGSEIDRAQQEGAVRELRARADQKAEMAAGVGQADGENHETAERDADGRQLWEISRKQADPDTGSDESHRPHGQDPLGLSGNTLDLCG
jgi:hypothetical protein